MSKAPKKAASTSDQRESHKQYEGFGPLLKRWREFRHLTQLDLALQIGGSARHVSFLETGRAKPSKEKLLSLANVLDLPLRERNILFLAAGFAPPYTETHLQDERMAQVRVALELMLRQHEPYSALACDQYWNLIMANAAYVQLLQFVLGTRAAALVPYQVLPAPRWNVIELVFDPNGLRPIIANWEQVAKAMLNRLQRIAIANSDPVMHALIETALAYPGVPTMWRDWELDTPHTPWMYCEITNLGAERNARMVSTLTKLESPMDITLEELHIEAFYPADPETAALTFYQPVTKNKL